MERTEERAVWFPMKSQYTVSSVLAAQQLGMREGDLTAVQTKQQEDVQTKQQEEIYLLNSTTAKLWLF